MTNALIQFILKPVWQNGYFNCFNPRPTKIVSTTWFTKEAVPDCYKALLNLVLQWLAMDFLYPVIPNKWQHTKYMTSQL